ncbi:flagellar hook-basal body protein [Bacillus horti]|uniref:Flagellar basal-body rod protein FlgG n=1 Tax=Caldalkalibacillus horti TaxID=77523 RepID=A0ABT9W032_9BACI|nr:flagellar hook-basal body protein [Bacillus horti]MDQ0166427.1 flagellar basal-body rod protein FlgG [Bacillus horti]
MFRGIYTATSGMVASGRKQEQLNHNLSNVDTPGYKQDNTVLRAFPDILMHRVRDEQGFNVDGTGVPTTQGMTPLGVLHTGVYAQEGIPLFRLGDLRETGRPLDIALVDPNILNPETGQQGHVFFSVQTGAEETRYTRNGQFSLDEQGYLTTSEGYYVLNNAQQPIQILSGEFRVSAAGDIYQITPLGENLVARLALAYTEEPEQLVKEGNSLYRFEGEGALQDLAAVGFVNGNNFQVRQGFIEGSNVDLTTTMTEMMSTYRLYEANQRVLQAYDRSLEKTVTEIGRV